MDKPYWHTVLMHLRRHFLRICNPECVVYNNATPVNPSGIEQPVDVWAVYSITPAGLPVYWEATFTDTGIKTRDLNGTVDFLDYGDVKSLQLPEKRSSIETIIINGTRVDYQRGYVVRQDGTLFEVLGSVRSSTQRDVYLWIFVTIARRKMSTSV